MSSLGVIRKAEWPREVGFSVRRVMEEPEKLKEDDAEVIILGCTAESGFMKEPNRRLDVPILDQ